ncbi:hypothetical protein C8Q80DRAFT_1270985 [Daedaleopsis nitida]|nr:hypothetical protein C8Q80DRAFT_1270985 [Daedaleopsis nitida]
MSLKIKIHRQNIPSEAKPTKRRIQRIESDEDDAGASPSYVPDIPQRRSKKARTLSRGASADSRDDPYAVAAEDEDVDIDGDIEDTRFLPEPQPISSRSISPAQPSLKLKLSTAGASSSKSRAKEKEVKPAKSGKVAVKKPKRQVVYTDSEEEFENPDVVVTDDDDFEPEPNHAPSKKGVKGKSVKLVLGKGKGKSAGATKKDEKEMTFRDERKLPPPPSVPDSSKRLKTEEDKRFRPDEDAHTKFEDEPAKTVAPDPLDEPIPKKRKLPPIKKNKPAGSSSIALSNSSTKPPAAPADKKETFTPALTSNQVGTRKPAGASTDINLLDSSVYSELFKSAPGGTTPNSGLNRKQKEEERKKELNKMRKEARAKREADARHAFDLQSSPEKIQRYEESLRTRQSMVRYPNILGAAFKEMFDRDRAARSVAAGPEQR